MNQVKHRTTTNNAPRIALIGCGAIADIYHLPALAKHQEVLDKVVLVDTSVERLSGLSAKYGIHNTTQDYHSILNEVDGVIIAVPHHLHHRISMDFLAAGVPVLCEKPLAELPSEAREMVALSQKTGTPLAANHTRRLFPANAQIREILQRNGLGRLKSIQYIDGNPFSWPSASGFYFKKASPTGVLLDRGVHSIDLICWWLNGKPTLLSSENDSFGGFEGNALVKMQHEECAIEIKLSWLTRLRNAYSIVGELGKIEGGIEEWDAVTIQYNNGKVARINLPSPERDYKDFGGRMIDNFIDVIQKGVKPSVPAEEVLHSIELIDQCYTTVKRFDMPWLTPPEFHYAS